MKRYLIILTLYLCAVVPTMAQYYSVNYDKRTVEAMTAAFATEAAASTALSASLKIPFAGLSVLYLKKVCAAVP